MKKNMSKEEWHVWYQNLRGNWTSRKTMRIGDMLWGSLIPIFVSTICFWLWLWPLCIIMSIVAVRHHRKYGPQRDNSRVIGGSKFGHPWLGHPY